MGLSVHRQSRSTRLARWLDEWRNGAAGSTIKQVWISLCCSPPLLHGGLQGVEPKLFFWRQTSIFGEAPSEPIFYRN